MTNKGISLHIGLNAVDPTKYNNWKGELYACEADAEVYRTIAEKAGFGQITSLLTADATAAQVLNEISKAAVTLQQGDLFFISYSGHGGSIPDTNHDEENDKMDETWCLYDRQLIDDEIFTAFSKFNAGVRILVFSDSCHSGSIARLAATDDEAPTDDAGKLRSRQMPVRQMIDNYTARKSMYDLLQDNNKTEPNQIGAYVLQFGACQDSELAMEQWGNGLFTAKVKKVLNGSLTTYAQLHEAVLKNFNPKQNPNKYSYGNKYFDFQHQPPFSIDGTTILPDDLFATPKATDKASRSTDNLIVQLYSDAGIGKQYKSRAGESRAKAASVVGGGGGRMPRFFTTDMPGDDTTDWDKAYETYLSDTNVKFAEPNIESPYLRHTATKGGNTNDYLHNWPAPEPSPTEFVWHLDDQHSQLRKAYDAVMTKPGTPARVRIGHIDTGYRPGHPSLPKHLRADLGVSFVNDEFGNNKGVDILKTGFVGEQDGHGCATLAILAGNEVATTDSYGNYEGWFGAVPFAEVVPIRICDTVFNMFNANDVADGIDYAVDYGCEVITMSMAGYPTKRVAEAVNRAYENGVIVVTAAGNNFDKGIAKLSPKAVLYPARFERVIAATGACYNHQPYDLDANDGQQERTAGGETMQGNWGPESAMKTAVAAYTPNVAWATEGGSFKFRKSGGGTSSATPQVAAAAALWVAHNRELIEQAGIDKSWKKVEAARRALFGSAAKSYPAFRKYYGNGIIQAHDALTAFNFSDVKMLRRSPEAKVGFTGFFDFLGGWFRSRAADIQAEQVDATNYEGLKEMVSLELVQLIYRDPTLYAYAEALDLENDDTAAFFRHDDTMRSFAQKVIASPFASAFVKNLLEQYKG